MEIERKIVEFESKYSFKNISSIRYVSAPCGSGKSFQAADHIAHLVELGGLALYVAPTKELLFQMREDLKKRDCEITLVTSDDSKGTTIRKIMQILKSPPKETHFALGITHASYLQLKYMPKGHDWEVFCDENPQFDEYFQIIARESAEIFDNLLKKIAINDKMYQIIPKNRRKIKAEIEKMSDEMFKSIKRIISLAASANYAVYVIRDEWDRIIEEGSCDKRPQISFLAILQPTLFVSTTLMAANLEESLLWKSAVERGISLRPHSITQKLRKLPLQGMRAKILYFFDTARFSKSLASRSANGVGTVIEEMDRKAAEIVGSNPVLCVSNKSHKSRVFRKMKNAVEIPIYSHGINKYQDYTHVYISAALNRSPKHLSMLRLLGYDSETVLNATAREVCYQAVMRTALRDAESNEEVTIIVPDLGTATYIAEKIGCSRVFKIGSSSLMELERAPALSDSERAKRSRLKQFVEETFCPQPSQHPLKRNRDVLEPDRSDDTASSDSVAAQSALGITPDQCLEGGHSPVLWTFHRSEKAFKPQEFTVLPLSTPKLVSLFKRFAETVQEHKGAGILFNAATYDPKDREGYRRQEHFVSSNALILDFDGGDLSPEEFEHIFLHGGDKPHSFVIMNSFSRCADKPNHFRVVMFYRDPASSIEEHKAVYDYVVGVLNSWGISEDSAKLDPNCKSGIMSVWMPCTNAKHREYAFFRAHHTNAREVKRHGLVPREFVRVQKQPKSPEPWEPIYVPNRDLRTKIEGLKAEILSLPEGRRNLVYRLGLLLKRANRDVAAELGEFAWGRDANLRRHVEGVITSLCQ